MDVGMLMHQVPFHSIISHAGKPGGFSSTCVYSCGKVELPPFLRRSKGRHVSTTVEDTSGVLCISLSLRIQQLFHKESRCVSLTTTPSEFEWAHSIEKREPELHEFLLNGISLSGLTWGGLSEVALAAFCRERRLTHFWNQIDPDFIVPGSAIMEKVAANALRLMLFVAEKICAMSGFDVDEVSNSTNSCPIPSSSNNECADLIARIKSLVDIQSDVSYQLGQSSRVRIDPCEWCSGQPAKSSSASASSNQKHLHEPSDIDYYADHGFNVTKGDEFSWKSIFQAVSGTSTFVFTPKGKTDSSSGVDADEEDGSSGSGGGTNNKSQLRALISLSMAERLDHTSVVTSGARGCLALCAHHHRNSDADTKIVCFDLLVPEGRCYQVSMCREDTTQHSNDPRHDANAAVLTKTDQPQAHLTLLRLLVNKRGTSITNRLTDDHLKYIVSVSGMPSPDVQLPQNRGSGHNHYQQQRANYYNQYSRNNTHTNSATGGNNNSSSNGGMPVSGGGYGGGYGTKRPRDTPPQEYNAAATPSYPPTNSYLTEVPGSPSESMSFPNSSPSCSQTTIIRRGTATQQHYHTIPPSVESSNTYHSQPQSHQHQYTTTSPHSAVATPQVVGLQDGRWFSYAREAPPPPPPESALLGEGDESLENSINTAPFEVFDVDDDDY